MYFPRYLSGMFAALGLLGLTEQANANGFDRNKAMEGLEAGMADAAKGDRPTHDASKGLERMRGYSDGYRCVVTKQGTAVLAEVVAKGRDLTAAEKAQITVRVVQACRKDLQKSGPLNGW